MGLFEAAKGGTVFLDEIGDMSPNLQATLLRVLQDNEIKPLGSTTTRKVDVRIIAATNKDLQQAIADGQFREDLFFRLNVLPLTLPPLNRRTEDIPYLLAHFIKREAAYLEIAPKVLDRRATALVMAYPWPGNVRELENFVKQVMVSTPGDTITPEDLPPHIASGTPGLPGRNPARPLRGPDLGRRGAQLHPGPAGTQPLGHQPRRPRGRAQALHLRLAHETPGHPQINLNRSPCVVDIAPRRGYHGPQADVPERTMPHGHSTFHPAHWYDANARTFFVQTVDLDTSEARERFMARLPAKGRVLDAGCGSGRDSLHFLHAGLAVDALDASPEMARLASGHTGLPVAHMDLLDLAPGADYDGIWAMASLIHLEPELLPRALGLLGLALRPGGALLASFRHGREGFTRHGLRFNALDENGLQELLAGQNLLRPAECWTRPDDRPGRSPWLYALMTRATDHHSKG